MSYSESDRSGPPGSEPSNRSKRGMNKNDLRYVKELIKENAQLDKYSEQSENRNISSRLSGNFGNIFLF